MSRVTRSIRARRNSHGDKAKGENFATPAEAIEGGPGAANGNTNEPNFPLPELSPLPERMEPPVTSPQMNTNGFSAPAFLERSDPVGASDTVGSTPKPQLGDNTSGSTSSQQIPLPSVPTAEIPDDDWFDQYLSERKSHAPLGQNDTIEVLCTIAREKFAQATYMFTLFDAIIEVTKGSDTSAQTILTLLASYKIALKRTYALTRTELEMIEATQFKTMAHVTQTLIELGDRYPEHRPK